MIKAKLVLVLLVAVVLGYAGLKLIDLGTDHIAKVYNRSEYHMVVLPCYQSPTDSQVVKTGKLALSYLNRGMDVSLCGEFVSREDAEEMANY